MINDIALVLSSLGVGGLLGIFAKSILDKQQFKFSKVFEYKEERYQKIAILMLERVNPTKYGRAVIGMGHPEMTDQQDYLDATLELEYRNAMIFASDNVLRNFEEFLKDKNMVNYESVARAIRQDLYY